MFPIFAAMLVIVFIFIEVLGHPGIALYILTGGMLIAGGITSFLEGASTPGMGRPLFPLFVAIVAFAALATALSGHPLIGYFFVLPGGTAVALAIAARVEKFPGGRMRWR